MPYKIYSANSPVNQKLNPKPFRLSQPRYCPQDMNVYENVVSGSPTVPSIMTTDTALWLDANDSSTITLESGAVSEWRDKSGNNRHATQATASNRPLLVANELNGTDVIRFDGGNDWMSGTYNGTINFPSHSIFIVNNYRALNSTFCVPLFPRADSGGIGIRETNKWYDAFGSFSVQSGGTATLGTHIISTIKENNLHNFFVNGVPAYSNNLAYGTSSATAYNLCWNSFGSYFANDISHIIIFPRVLTQAERELVEGYLAWTTRLEGSLPSNHPYKNSYPGITVTTTLVGDYFTINTYPNLNLGVSVSPSSVLENSGTPFVFTFTLSQSIGFDTVITYSLSGTAIQGSDYPNQTGTVTILANQTTATVNITPTDDALAEGNETITLTILNAIADSQFVALSPLSATATIEDDD